ncbi:MAG: phosphatidate cytidylyltransferase [Terrimicrobiaceae bacterium]|nr:phosphatidate cytidylyltransferase [Terrimicrobiaceae bacterium]
MSGGAASVVFRRRLASTLILWALIAAALFWNHEAGYFALIAGIGLKALREYFALAKAQGAPVFTLTGMACAAVYFAGAFLDLRRAEAAAASGGGAGIEAGVLVAFLLVVFARQMTRSSDAEPFAAVAYTVFGLLYVPWMFNFLTKILFLAPRTEAGATTGQFYILFLLVVTKFSDMGAYVFGSLFGRHALAPSISPKKTWEGLAGAIFSALLGSLWVYGLMAGSLSALRLQDVLILGVGLGVVAVIGDLAESVIKRGALAKDSGSAVPGIGGALDLIDSLLFTAPLMYFYLLAVAGS